MLVLCDGNQMIHPTISGVGNASPTGALRRLKTFLPRPMPKSTIPYWNPLHSDNQAAWQPIAGLEDFVEELTLSIDADTGEYTRLTRFHPGADTTPFGSKSHTYPEEILIVSGRLYDQAFDLWLESGLK